MTLDTDLARASQDASALAERLLDLSKAVPVIPPPPAPIWQILADEPGPFEVTGTQTVRYGKGDRWVKKLVSGKGAASNGFFGSDPVPGVTKQAQVLIVPGTILPKAKGTAAVPAPAVPAAEKPVINIGPMWKPPKVITSGGVYEGMWKSDDPAVAAVTIRTSELVELRGEADSKGHVVSAPWAWVNLVIRQMQARGVNPNVLRRVGGRFLAAEGVESLLIEDSDITGSSGVYVNTWRPSKVRPYSIIMQRLRGKNMEGRLSDGRGGYLQEFYRGQYVQLNNLANIPGVLLDLLRLDNTARESFIEDAVNFHNCTGTLESFMRITRSLINGAFGSPVDGDYTGGGIMLGDGEGGKQEALKNTVIETSNYGLAVSNGNHIRVVENIALGLGKLPDGTILDSTPDCGFYARDYDQTVGKPDTYRDPSTVLFQDNLAGWMRPTANNPTRRNDYGVAPDQARSVNNRSVIGDVTPAMLTSAIADWEAMASRAGMKHAGRI
ncbi:hypothetical protein ACI3L1_06780 [Deinococcus sp. SM5_A1]|uniref:hypothetical protein n=1 Tax=Deinococcus sp. SM5_A1 TaxID=3379094 RepID=UPI0038582AB6